MVQHRYHFLHHCAFVCLRFYGSQVCVSQVCVSFITDAGSLYMLSSGDNQLFEVKAFEEDFHSWFVGQTVQRGRFKHTSTQTQGFTDRVIPPSKQLKSYLKSENWSLSQSCLPALPPYLLSCQDYNSSVIRRPVDNYGTSASRPVLIAC